MQLLGAFRPVLQNWKLQLRYFCLGTRNEGSRFGKVKVGQGFEGIDLCLRFEGTQGFRRNPIIQITGDLLTKLV